MVIQNIIPIEIIPGTHDIRTTGGSSSEIEEPPEAVEPSELIVLDGVIALPVSFDPGRTHVVFDLDLSGNGGDLDISSWAPVSPFDHIVEFTFRKTDQSANKVIWTDPSLGQDYSFVSRRGEFITLSWDAMATRLFIV